MTKTESAVQWAIGIANDNRHGYSQSNRWGNPDYDCSSLVISAWQQAGVPVKSNGATYTGNMYNVFRACGFTDVTASCNRATGAGMQRGDVLLNVRYHTAMYIGGGQMVQASSTRGHPEAGDQTGTEIWVCRYYNYSRGWNYVLRYTAGGNSGSSGGQEPIQPPSGVSLVQWIPG
jgi:cell wall-associated NlpC family hydrolase